MARTGRPKQRYCLNGHDTNEVGRDDNYRCKQCRNDAARRIYAEKHKIDPGITLEEVMADIQAMRARVRARRGERP